MTLTVREGDSTKLFLREEPGGGFLVYSTPSGLEEPPPVDPAATSRRQVHASSPTPIPWITVPMGHGFTFAGKTEPWPLSSSTDSGGAAERLVLEALTHELATLRASARAEVFQDGFTSNFSIGLNRLVSRFGDIGVQGLFNLIADESLPVAVTVDLLRTLGRIVDPGTHGRRFQLLVHALNDARVTVRDEAALALLDLGDVRAQPHVLEAAEREPLARLKADLLETAAQME